MGSTSLIKDRRSSWRKNAGFTLAEVMMVTLISSFVFAAVLSSYVFLGRGLVREGNAESLESSSRVAIYYFTQDLSASCSLTNASSGTLGVNVGPSTSYTNIVYTYDSIQGTLTRSVGASTTTLLTGLTSFTFYYFDLWGIAPSPTPAGTTWIKQVSMSYTTVAGALLSGAQSKFSMTSPPVVMKNKGLLQ
jgi:prepilin-type N-terminal cleavage/methylation domain-containing protein